MRRPVVVKKDFHPSLFLGKVFPSPSCRCCHPSIRTRDERFSLGASWVFSFQPVLPPVRRPLFHRKIEVGQAVDAVTGTRLWAFVFHSKNGFDFMPLPATLPGCCCATVRRLLRLPTTDAARLPAFVPSQSPLASSHSSHHAPPVLAPSAADRCLLQTDPECDAQIGRAHV